jgi:hypothetical protein
MESTKAPVESSSNGLWKFWRIYLVRWLIFAFIAGLFQPVTNNFGQFWVQKLYQVLGALPFGVACALVFTMAQNTLNFQRVRWKSWAIVLTTWMGMKFVFVGIMLALDVLPLK